MSESFICRHCTHFPNVAFKIGDTVQIDPDPDDDESDIHRGTIIKIKPKNKQITIRKLAVDNHEICSYFWDDIDIQIINICPLYDDTECKQTLQQKNKMIKNIQFNLQNEIAAKKKYKNKFEEEQKLRLKQHEDTAKFELLVKILREQIAEKDIIINNMHTLLESVQKENDKQTQTKQHKHKEYEQIMKQTDERVNSIKLLMETMKDKMSEQIKNEQRKTDQYKQKAEEERNKRLDIERKYQLKHSMLMENDEKHELEYNALIKQMKIEKNTKKEVIQRYKMEKQRNVELKKKYEDYDGLKCDLEDVAYRLNEEIAKRERLEKRIKDYKQFANIQMDETKKVRKMMEIEQKEKEEIVETVITQKEIERIQKETERSQKEEFMKKADQQKQENVEIQIQYETDMKHGEEERDQLMEENRNLETQYETDMKQGLDEKNKLMQEKGKLMEEHQNLETQYETDMKQGLEEKNKLMQEKGKLMQEHRNLETQYETDMKQGLEEKNKLMQEKGKIMEEHRNLETQYEADMKQGLEEKNKLMQEKGKLMEDKRKLLELNEKLAKIVEDEKKQTAQKEEEYKLLREKLIKLDANIQYPAFWDRQYMTINNYAKPKLIDMTTNGIHPKAQEVMNRFYLTAHANTYQIIKVEGVQNQMLYDKHWNETQSMIKSIGGHKLSERYLFHGTRSEQVMTFVETEGFRKEFNRAAAYGFGTYLARDASYSVGYSSNNNGVHKMFQCVAICGESHVGSGAYTLNLWPKKTNGLIYDSLVNNVGNPSIFVIHNDVRVYPMFVITFRRK